MDHREGSPTHQAMGLILCVTRLHRRIVEKRFSHLNLHHSQHRLLMHLAHSGKMPAQKELAKQFDISPAAVAVMLKKLSASGYIAKTGSDRDNRRNEISITPAGKALVEQSYACFQEIENAMFEGMTDEETDCLKRALTRVQVNLSKYEERLNTQTAPEKE